MAGSGSNFVNFLLDTETSVTVVMSQPDKNASPDRLEGTLLKQGGKGLKAWRKRVFKADGAKPFLYHYEPPGKHLKGVVDLTSVVSVQSIEGRVSIRYCTVPTSHLTDQR